MQQNGGGILATVRTDRSLDEVASHPEPVFRAEIVSSAAGLHLIARGIGPAFAAGIAEFSVLSWATAMIAVSATTSSLRVDAPRSRTPAQALT